MRKHPCAIAEIHGSKEYTGIKGTVKFHHTPYGVLVMVDIRSLPYSKEKCSGRIFAFHIHSGNSCSGTEHDPFSDAMATFRSQIATDYNMQEIYDRRPDLRALESGVGVLRQREKVAMSDMQIGRAHV